MPPLTRTDVVSTFVPAKTLLTGFSRRHMDWHEETNYGWRVRNKKWINISQPNKMFHKTFMTRLNTEPEPTYDEKVLPLHTVGNP